MLMNLATIKHVLSANFIATCVRRTKSVTAEVLSVDLQYQYNATFNFDRTLLSQPEYDVRISVLDVERAVAMGTHQPAKHLDGLGIIYNWLRGELDCTMYPDNDRLWGRFVGYVKKHQLTGHFGTLPGSEVRGIFNLVYPVVKPSMSSFVY